MNENNKVFIRSTGTFKYTPYPNGLPRDLFPGEYFLLNLNLEQDRLQLANILHPAYRYKGFIMIEAAELKKIELLGYKETLDKLIAKIEPERSELSFFDGSSTYTPPTQLEVPQIGSAEIPRIDYPGISIDIALEESKSVKKTKATSVVEEPVVAEKVTEVVIAEEVVIETVPEVPAVVIDNSELKETLEAVHYKKLQKIGADKDLNYDNKEQFIELLLSLPTEEFSAIYSEYLSS
jgi:hypothetical protein